MIPINAVNRPTHHSESDSINLLIVENDPKLREMCRAEANALGFYVYTATNKKSVYRQLENQSADIVLLDLTLPKDRPLEVLDEMLRRNPNTIVILVTPIGKLHSIASALQSGMFDFLTKPFRSDELHLALQRASRRYAAITAQSSALEDIQTQMSYSGLIGKAPAMEQLFRMISKVAATSYPVLILGESGTGKELVAKAIHDSSSRKEKPFFVVDCGSLAPSLIESELFGHIKGAFTGASQSKAGLLSMANGGTVLLDEIGELPLDLQTKLLRALQEKEIRPVGSLKNAPMNVRILAATNRDLELDVQKGTFRKDLYFRLNVICLRMPALRERKADIPLLARYFIQQLYSGNDIRHVLSNEALDLMMPYEWPGNVRELKNCIMRALALTSSGVIRADDLPIQIQQLSESAPNGFDDAVSIAELEKRAIISALGRARGNKLLAAKSLGIGKTTLYRKLKQYVQVLSPEPKE